MEEEEGRERERRPPPPEKSRPNIIPDITNAADRQTSPSLVAPSMPLAAGATRVKMWGKIIQCAYYVVLSHIKKIRHLLFYKQKFDNWFCIRTVYELYLANRKHILTYSTC